MAGSGRKAKTGPAYHLNEAAPQVPTCVPHPPREADCPLTQQTLMTILYGLQVQVQNHANVAGTLVSVSQPPTLFPSVTERILFFCLIPAQLDCIRIIGTRENICSQSEPTTLFYKMSQRRPGKVKSHDSHPAQSCFLHLHTLPLDLLQN